VGSVIEVIARQPGGAIVIGHQDTRLALGGGMAHNIAVISWEST
jgi:Fe2+ transport system protein FeoA